MPRRHRAEQREILPDPIYNDLLVARFINSTLKRGKKALAEHIFYGAMASIQQRTETEGIEVFKKAVSNVSPALEVKSRRVGGATYQVPIEVTSRRKTALAIRWILAAARARNEKSMQEKLAAELSAAANGDGAAVKKKSDTHRMAEANKAFAHFRW